MPSERHLRYGRPTPPADVNQEFMTIQETAWVLGCSVETIRRRLKALRLNKKPGRRVITSKKTRDRLYQSGSKPLAPAA